MADTPFSPVTGSFGMAGLAVRVPAGGVTVGPVTVKATGRRPELAWTQGLTGRVKSRPRGRTARVLLIDATGRPRHARMGLGDFT